MQKRTLNISDKEAGLTLLSFIAQILGISRKAAKTLIDDRNVFVNRRRIWIAKHALKKGDTVEITSYERRDKTSGISVLYDDNEYMIIDKRPGIVSNGENSVETLLRIEHQIPALLSVHRLDRDTSGCLLMAKNSKAFNEAVHLFKTRQVDKTYHVIASGGILPKEQTIREPIQGKPAATLIKIVDSNRDASHVQAHIKTGRTHQIRKHLAFIGSHVIGDRQYGTSRKVDKKAMQANRQMLHASALRFKHPFTGREVRARAPLPGDFRKCLKLYNLS